MSNSSDTFGARLSEALSEAGLSQAELARRVDVNAKTIERYASRDQPPSLQREDVRNTLAAISRELEVRKEWLVDGEGQKRGAGERAGFEGTSPLRHARERAGLSYSEAAEYLRGRGVDVSEQDLIEFERSGDADVGQRSYGAAIYLLARHGDQSGDQPSGAVQSSDESRPSEGSRPGGQGLEEEDLRSEVQVIPELQAETGEEVRLALRKGGFILSKTYIRQRYGTRPGRVVALRVRGNGMVDTLRPGQVVLASRWREGQDLEDGAIYGLKGPHGFSIRRLQFDHGESGPGIWIWADNDDCADQRRRLRLQEFRSTYQVIAVALGVEHRL